MFWVIIMFYTYEEVIKKYKNDYQLKKAIDEEKVYKVKPGMYSKGEPIFLLAELFFKRDDIILTLQSAFHHHRVTDYIPEYTFVATPRNAYPIDNKEVKQVFMSKKYHQIGMETYKESKINICVYDFERSLIELIRYQTKIPFEEYHHVLHKFREKKNEIDFNRLQAYAKQFKSYLKIMRVIQDSIV